MVGRNNPRDQLIRDARDAFGRRDRVRLATLRDQAVASRHPLAQWVDYWELTQRITEVNADEIEAFYVRWPGTYVEDRLRNDWLLELGRRRDWAGFSRDYPRFRMNDDREVTCYATLIDHLAGKDVRAAARAAWLAQRDADDGCQLLAQTMYDDKAFTDEDIQRRLRQSAEYGRQRAARAAAQIQGKAQLKTLNELWDNPARFLTMRGSLGTTRRSDLVTLALARMAANDAGAAALQMSERWESTLDRGEAAWTWAMIAKHGAQSLAPDATEWADHAWSALKPRKGVAADRPDWGDDALDWHARAAVRAATGPGAAQRWRDLLRAIDAMSPADRASEAWVYWRARAQLALARDTPEGEATRADAHAALAALSTSLTFYGLLAAEDLGTSFALPPRPTATTSAERGSARALPGLQRALALASLEMRDEARREWNYTLRGMDDRQLLAAAQWACEVGDWQLCINTSERTKNEIDLMQRYPMPYQRDIAGAAQAVGLEPAFVFGLIRQETRFMAQLRSHVGAAGLMQIMPSTAKWAAKKSGIPYAGDQITDPQTNLRLGTFYLKLVLDSFGSSEPMAAAAYNAGPARSRRWRGTLMLDPAVWTENVPFYETRDYVKRVMTNAAVYAALQSGQPPTLRPRLGPQIGPRDAEQPTQDIP
jgi:soluble lytic murein transglycosylase